MTLFWNSEGKLKRNKQSKRHNTYFYSMSKFIYIWPALKRRERQHPTGIHSATWFSRDLCPCILFLGTNQKGQNVYCDTSNVVASLAWSSALHQDAHVSQPWHHWHLKDRMIVCAEVTPLWLFRWPSVVWTSGELAIVVKTCCWCSLNLISNYNVCCWGFSVEERGNFVSL